MSAMPIGRLFSARTGPASIALTARLLSATLWVKPEAWARGEAKEGLNLS